ncbi:MAG: hypothetical protein LBP56_03085, partial [Odoribacteraceae bacterium]|nr:hypothetical protein [Odoribacteraceae bacterium]
MERQHILTLLAVSFISFSCNKEMYYLESALQFAGDNRPELEKVLKHYSSPADNLKYRAAVFLIKNMPAYYGHEGAAVDTIRKALTAVYDVYGYFYDEKLIRAAKEFSYDDLT